MAHALNLYYYNINNVRKLCTSTVLLSSHACTWQIPEGNGSGVVWDGQGHIVTNYHGKPVKRFMCFCMHALSYRKI